jgi:hypothetical protein
LGATALLWLCCGAKVKTNGANKGGTKKLNNLLIGLAREEGKHAKSNKQDENDNAGNTCPAKDSVKPATICEVCVNSVSKISGMPKNDGLCSVWHKADFRLN